MDRRVRLEGVDNFRDFGGYAAGDGRRMKRGRLWRSAGHGRATDADLDAIAALDLAVIVDLRRAGERARVPSRRHGGFGGVEVVCQHADPAEDPWIAFIKSSDLSEAAFRDYLLGYYAAAPFEPRHIALFADYFQHLAQAEGPVLIHCAAGKDRTGILAAMTHRLLGVAEDDVVADYLLSNDPERMPARVAMVGDVILAETGRRPSDAAVRTAMSVEAEYLAAAFAAIAARCGDVDAYLAEVLGVDASMRAAIEAKLVKSD